MFEHVGIDNHPPVFRRGEPRCCGRGGLYLHHAISRPAKGDDRSFRKMRAEYRALTRYIFPGGELDHLGMSIANLERAKLRGPRRRGLARALSSARPGCGASG